MTTPDTQKYLFDLHGYLVIEDVLTAEEVSELNRLIDESGHTSTDEVSGTLPGGGAGEEGAGFLEWGQVFTKILDHPKVMPVLRMIIGDGFRIDHFWGAWANSGAKALHLHGGIVPFVQTDYYYVREGKIRSGLTNMAWNLTDSGGDLGGFMALPGSHKSNFEVPDEIREATEGYGIDVPEVKAGSVSIFTEAVLHGTAPWRGSHQRRTLFFSMGPSHQAYSWHQAVPPTTVELTERQKLLFSRPSAPHSFGRPTLFEPELEPVD